MRGTETRSASDPDHPVWHALSSYSIGPDTAALSFAQRLARENGWSAEFAAQVITEYKRFCFLAVTGSEEVTPSDQVDQAWHLHLTYTRDYWERFCPEVLGKPLHHGPTKGGEAEQGRFFEQYARTLRRYEQVFGQPPPAAIWPDARRRLFDDPRARRIHPRDALVVPRRLLWVVLAGAALAVFLAITRSWI
jgi:hypothetical protein